MGPNEGPHNFSNPARADSVESDDEEMARLRVEGWQIGFGVEMRVAIAEENVRINDGIITGSADSEESDATGDSPMGAAASDVENDEEFPAPNDGYVPLPSSVVDEEPSSTLTTARHWLPSNPAPANWILPPPAPTADLDHIQHQPIDINLDQVKVEEIKRIMSQMTVSSMRQQPGWIQQFDDTKLTELVDQLKNGKVADGK